MSSSVAEYDGLVDDGVRPVLGDASAEVLQEVLDRLAGMDGSAISDADRIDLLGLLEQLKGAAAAAQARVTVEFETSRLAAQDARGVRARDRGRGIGDRVALARGCAASQGRRHLGFAKAIVAEMLHTHALLSTGDITEWTATLLVKETAILTLEDRRLVDERLCAMRVDTASGQILPPVVLGLTSNQAGGRASADAVPVEIELVLDCDTLIGASERTARAHGGPAGGCVVPAATAREWVTRGDAPVWLRRVFTDPIAGQVVDVESKRRRFHSAPDARFTRTRDQHCRHPRCEGAIRHIDHPEPFAQGGASTRANSQGLCEPHNYVKQMPGWSTRVVDERPGDHTIEVTTPTGHTYQSKAPPGLPPPV